MTKDWKITCFKPDRPGVFYKENHVRFAADLGGSKDCGILFYDKNGESCKIPFSDAGTNGTLAGIEVELPEDEEIKYNYYKEQGVFTDPYAPKVKGLEIWGGAKGELRETTGCISLKKFDWEGDENPCIPYEDSIIYGLNVRSFTMHKSAGVKHGGTFEGVTEKIPYLKSLGITAVELMPCYEYEECMIPTKQIPAYAKKQSDLSESEAAAVAEMAEKTRLNCWGFQKGFYFAPKASYSACGDGVISFKTMVKKLHQSGIEVLMHFYFPPEVRALQVLDVLKFWVGEYHVDGFRISGVNIPYRILTEEPVLAYTKLRFGYLPEAETSLEEGRPARNLAVDNQGFLADMRRYLKGDEGLINQVLSLHRHNPKEYGTINYLTDYNSFSLYDMVSYECKHNEANGEENRDGSDMNYSWNCGIEGDSRKKSIQALRIRQMKNALVLLFLSQGTPYIFAGDELANTRFGNNNPYCQDNEIGWVKWKETKVSKEVTEYTKYLISLRWANKILHMEKEFKIMDAKRCGMPDISYHGVEAWRPDLGHMSRMIGIMLCGAYAGAEESFYIGYNMHWEAHEMALPKLPKDMIWTKISDTAWEKGGQPENVADQNLMITVDSRSVVIYRTQKIEIPEKKRNGKAMCQKV
ncbi:MAG: hypothetical protein IJ409_03205 [Lachnospiraceae bacterium]|nr:hypothetical protein [Lachnospiraceae bacterium]